MLPCLRSLVPVLPCWRSRQSACGRFQPGARVGLASACLLEESMECIHIVKSARAGLLVVRGCGPLFLFFVFPERSSQPRSVQSVPGRLH